MQEKTHKNDTQNKKQFANHIIGLDKKMHDCADGRLCILARGETTHALGLIFEYDSLSEYGKVIFDEVRTFVFGWNSKSHDAMAEYGAFIKNAVENPEKKERLIYLFWALLLWACGEEKTEEVYSKIETMAKELEITEQELLDVKVAAVLLLNPDRKFPFITPNGEDTFKCIFKKTGTEYSV